MLFDRTFAAKPCFFRSIAAQAGLAAVLCIPISMPAQASSQASNDEDHARALRIAQKKVERKRSVQNARVTAQLPGPTQVPTPGAAAAYARLRGSSYSVGDSWTVAAQQILPSMMRKTSDTEHLQPRSGPIAVLEYRVAALEPRLRIEIREQQRDGFAPVDPRVDKIEIEIDDMAEQVSKTYFMRSSSGVIPVKVSPEGLRSRITPLELYPIDVPSVLGTEQSAARSFPGLTPELRSAAVRLGAERLARVSEGSKWMEQDDFFGREVQLLWKPGEPWPAYVKTPQGVAVLIGQGEGE